LKANELIEMKEKLSQIYPAVEFSKNEVNKLILFAEHLQQENDQLKSQLEAMTQNNESQQQTNQVLLKSLKQMSFNKFLIMQNALEIIANYSIDSKYDRVDRSELLNCVVLARKVLAELEEKQNV
jgi:regulator of replication initiation timing